MDWVAVPVGGRSLHCWKSPSFHCCRPNVVVSSSPHFQSFPKRPCFSPYFPNLRTSLIARAKKRGDSNLQPVLKETAIEGERGEDEVYEEGSEGEYVDDFEDGILMDDDDGEDFEDDFDSEDGTFYVGNGGDGGGISLAGTWWDKQALSTAEEVLMTFNGDLKLYAFRTSANCTIYVRIEKLSTKYGSPTITDIQAFSSAYQARLDEAELTGTVPNNISLEVSSPGLERVVRIPEDLERFKDLPMFVKYITFGGGAASPQENDGVFKLVSYDLESCHCTWGLADVRVNREQAGKGRPLSKKQREWRLQTSFDSLRLVRRFSDI